VLRVLQTHLLPGTPAVHRPVDTVSIGNASLAVVLSRADPHIERVLRVDGHAPDGVRALVVEDRLPCGAVVDGQPDTAGSHGHDVVGPVGWVHGNVGDTACSEGGTDPSKLQTGEGARRERTLILLLRVVRLAGGGDHPGNDQ
jgi:hypothetical protein